MEGLMIEVVEENDTIFEVKNFGETPEEVFVVHGDGSAELTEGYALKKTAIGWDIVFPDGRTCTAPDHLKVSM